MRMRLRLALRNILRHRTRSLLNVLMIGGAVAAIILFRGFSDRLLELLRNNAIDALYGHLQVAKDDYWEKSPIRQKKIYMGDVNRLRGEIASEPGVERVSPRASTFVLISSGDRTINAMAMGYDPENDSMFANAGALLAGRFLKDARTPELLLGKGLAKQLAVRAGESVTLLGNTLDGVMNAMDVDVVGIFTTGMEEIDNMILYMPFQLMQTLLETDKAEVFSVRAREGVELEELQGRLGLRMARVDAKLQVKSWHDLGELYRSTESFLGLQNSLFAGILVSLILLGIMNSVGMSVYERTGEIGTVRALGERRSGVIQQFVIEAALQGVIGLTAGFCISLLVVGVLELAKLSLLLPGGTLPVPIEINLVPKAVWQSVLVALGASVCSALVPAFRASRISVVEALRRNI